jgi:hypothetical protein
MVPSYSLKRAANAGKHKAAPAKNKDAKYVSHFKVIGSEFLAGSFVLNTRVRK